MNNLKIGIWLLASVLDPVGWHYGNQSRGCLMGGGPLWPPTEPGLQPGPPSQTSGSGLEVLKRERGHVTSESGVSKVGVFRALQPNGNHRHDRVPRWMHYMTKLWSYETKYYHFYPRPVLAFGYCHCLRLCVCLCQSVCQSLACLRDNSGPVQAWIIKFGPKVQNNLVRIPIVLWGDWPWPSRSNIRSESKFTPFWACPHYNSSPIQARITKFGPEVENTSVRILSVL